MPTRSGKQYLEDSLGKTTTSTEGIFNSYSDPAVFLNLATAVFQLVAYFNPKGAFSETLRHILKKEEESNTPTK